MALLLAEYRGGVYNLIVVSLGKGVRVGKILGSVLGIAASMALCSCGPRPISFTTSAQPLPDFEPKAMAVVLTTTGADSQDAFKDAMKNKLHACGVKVAFVIKSVNAITYKSNVKYTEFNDFEVLKQDSRLSISEVSYTTNGAREDYKLELTQYSTNKAVWTGSISFDPRSGPKAGAMLGEAIATRLMEDGVLRGCSASPSK